MEKSINIKLVDFKYLSEEAFNARRDKSLKEYIEIQNELNKVGFIDYCKNTCFSTGEVEVKDLNDLKNIFGKNIEVNNYINFEQGLISAYNNYSGQNKKGIMFEPIICTSFVRTKFDLEGIENIENLCDAFIYLYQNSEDYKECIENFKYKLKLDPNRICQIHTYFDNVLRRIEFLVNKELTERANEYPDLQPLQFDILNEDVETTMNKIRRIAYKEIEKYSSLETVTSFFSSTIREKKSEDNVSFNDPEQLFLKITLKEVKEKREKEREEKIRKRREESLIKAEDCKPKEKNRGCTIF